MTEFGQMLMTESPKKTKDSLRSGIRFIARYALAAALIPLGVALGIGGAGNYALKKLRRRSRSGNQDHDHSPSPDQKHDP